MKVQSITYLLADDDLIYREHIKQILNLIPDLKCVGECDHAPAALAILRQQQVDLLILDMAMPGLSGLQLVKSLSQQPMVIFVSSHTEYAAEAFEVDALDYLVKPVAPERVIRAIDKVRHLIDLKRSAEGVENVKKAEDNALFIRDKGAYNKLLFDDVLYIESLGDFVVFFLTNGIKKTVLVNLRNVEQQLTPMVFIRISRTHIVNKQKITSLENGWISLGQVQLPIGKSFSDAVFNSVVGDSFLKRHV